MAPYPKGVTKFMNSGGFYHLRLSTLENQHIHVRFESPLTPTLNLYDLKTTPAITGSPFGSQCAGAEGVAGRFEYELGPATSPE